MEFPDCSPNFGENYLSEKTKMFLNEEIYIRRWVNIFDPSHIIILDKFYQNILIQNMLKEKEYEKVYLLLFLFKFLFFIKVEEFFQGLFDESPFETLWNNKFIVLSKQQK